MSIFLKYCLDITIIFVINKYCYNTYSKSYFYNFMLYNLFFSLKQKKFQDSIWFTYVERSPGLHVVFTYVFAPKLFLHCFKDFVMNEHRIL